MLKKLQGHLVAIRKAKGLTQEEVAELMGVGQPRVAQIEKNSPKFESLEAYAKALGMNIFYQIRKNRDVTED